MYSNPHAVASLIRPIHHFFAIGKQACATCGVKLRAHHYHPPLRRYLELSQGGHSPNTLKHAFAFHSAYQQTGSMLNAQL